MPVAVAEKGLKRICPSCGARYYDLNKRPVLCPDCATEFTGELKVKARRGRAATPVEEDETNSPATANRKPANEDVDDEEDNVEAEVETVSLDEVEKTEAADADDEDVVLDDDLDDDLDDLDDDLDDDVGEPDAEEEEEEDDKA